MTSSEIRQRFLDFFAKRGRDHVVLQSASLVPQNDPSVLFNTAGMQPLVPYLLGEKHPNGTRLVNVQKCVRTQDIEEVGDNTHDTFFEMLGNWSLGDYFKEDAIRWSYEFLTSKEEGLGLDPRRLYITVFEGDENAPRDEDSYQLWKNLFEKDGIAGERIYFMGVKSNWWSVGDNGPCGPDTEMFYDLTGTYTEGLTKEKYLEHEGEQELVEIWNDVFMEYEKKDGVIVGKLKNKNVDTGSGLERVVMAVQGKDNIFDTDLFKAAADAIRIESLAFSGSDDEKQKAQRIALDHFRTAIFLAADGVIPSNKDAGYIMRRLIRRGAVYFRKIIGSSFQNYRTIFELLIQPYENAYPEIIELEQSGFKVIFDEIEKFQKNLVQGLKEFERLSGRVTGQEAFDLLQTYGFPIELTMELAAEKGIIIDMVTFEVLKEEHAEKSRSGAAQKFKGGLADTGEKTTKLHTAHHLLLAALQKVLGPEVHQRGSNITGERLRIDFNFDRKMTDEEKSAAEQQVNEWIQNPHQVCRREMPLADAKQLGAEMEFGAKYPEVVSLYYISPSTIVQDDAMANAISIEFCGGPHVENTAHLGTFKIQKEEAVAAGIRRIKATLT
jgi:alanyl-tRNA synthetase